ncbi:AMP-binding protein [Simplicispira psychrophila]|uniref:AMP-binding protein n=1 Tax=Simplicispira psychrophila TaxID=80882 RepID=UPI0004890385|nr:AMP-binding protein [Simplicispira psychrophila]
MKTLPLLPGALTTQAIAYRQQHPVSQAEFLGDIFALAARLPQTGHVFNLCKDRYWFSVALFAAISRGMVSLLQNSTASENMTALFSDFPDAVCLGEQTTPMLAQMPYVVVPHATLPAAGTDPEMPQIPCHQQIVRIFTSGSTGKPQGHSMSFGRMHHCAIAEAERLWDVAGGPCSVLGTVSPQHMFGLEATVLLPIFGGGQFSARQPFFPADVASALAEMPEPRLLVSTPFHLRKLMDAQISLPRVSAILSATAPLSQELAQEVEAQLNAPMVEIYGSTETGALATRRPAQDAEWTTYSGIALEQDQDQQTQAHAKHFDAPQTLNDAVELLSPTRFRLQGRNSDMINIVGKRNSLAFLNQLLLNLPGVKDGVFCTHDISTADETARLAAFIVAPTRTGTDILAALRQHVDPVFLPRPLVFVESLPRDANGKLPASALAALRATHLAPRV